MTAEVSMFSASPANALAGSPQPFPQKLLYDRKNAAYVLSISVRALDYLIAAKKLATIKVGKKIMIGHGTLVKFSRMNHSTLTEQAGMAQ